jgi:hypothetical protein
MSVNRLSWLRDHVFEQLLDEKSVLKLVHDLQDVLSESNLLSKSYIRNLISKVIEKQSVEAFVFLLLLLLVILERFFHLIQSCFVFGFCNVLIERWEEIENNIVALEDGFAVVNLLCVFVLLELFETLKVLDFPHAKVNDDSKWVHFAQDGDNLLQVQQVRLFNQLVDALI